MFLGNAIRVYAVAVILFLPAIISGQEVISHTYNFGDNSDKEEVITSQNGITINYSLPKIYLQNISNSNGNFFRLTAPGHNSSPDPGRPELPVLSRLIIIPANSTPKIRISEIKSQKIIPSRSDIRGVLYPRQPSRSKSQEKDKTDFVIDRTVYGKRGLIISDTVKIEFLGKVRNNQLANIYITPARYNPFRNELEVITSMKVEITFPDKNGISKTGSNAESALFTETLGKGTLNFSQSDLINGYSDKPVGMVIITDTSFKKLLQPLINWKIRKGFKVTTLYKGSKYAGTTFAQIKDTLSKIYKSATTENPAPEYLLIIGDVNIIPKSDGTNYISDLYWGEFDGNGDYLPDMYIGRLPVADTNDLKAVVNKILQYETFQVADTNTFYKRAIVTAGNDPGYSVYMNGQVNYASTYYLNKPNNIDSHVFLYPASASADDSIKKLINKGVSFINYSGHGEPSYWVDPTLRASDVDLFTNKNMYPFVITNACQTASFELAGSLSNKMVVTPDKGAIGFIGCSADSYWDEDYFWAVGVGPIKTNPLYSETGLGAYDRLFHKNNENPSDWYITMGQVNYAGNLSVSASTSNKWKKYYWETYSLIGDPSIIPVIGKPEKFNVTLPDTIPNGIKTLILTLDPYSYIAVSHWNNLWDASYASPSGSVELNMPGLSNDSCLVVITGQNKIPLIKRIYISDINNEYINLTSALVDDSEANNNGVVDYGETFFLTTKVSNLGKTDATELFGKITTTSDWVTVIKDTAIIGTLPGKSEITISGKFKLTVDDLITDKGFITLDLMLKDKKIEKHYKLDIQLHAPLLKITNCIIDDTQTGNGDLVADPGETVKLLISVSNSGSSSTSGLLKVTNSPAGITISQPTVSTGSLLPGVASPIPVTVTISPLMLKGTSFDIGIMLDCSPYVDNKTFSIPVGRIRESFEYNTFTMFPWINSPTKPWTIISGQSFEGQFSARSAVISNNSESVLKIYVNTPYKDTVKFMYKVSSEANYDYLAFRLNNVQVMKVSGEAGWSEKKAELREGFNLLEWIYKKDESVSVGMDCAMIDLITFPAAGFNKIDLKTGKIVTPQPNKDYAQETITAQVINFGTDTIKSFNLAYTVNKSIPVKQVFSKKIAPADTGVVAFSAQANLLGDGTYLIKVYGFNNNDGYLKNDTASLTIINTAITPVENPDNNVRIMPNPFDFSFRIMLNSPDNENLNITIFDPSGKALWNKNLGVMPGDNILTITPENLDTGLYILHIKGKSIYKVARIIKK